jgi:AAHS family 4-hydroxybenzoate transporter-like MFS transporter
MERAPTVSEMIDQRPLSRYQIWTMSLCAMVVVLDGFDTQSIGFLAPSMAETLHVSVKNFGPVFGAALLGLMISSMLIGPIADRWGRKWPIVICTLVFGAFAMLTARVTSLPELWTIRFVTGLGLGGALSNVVALMSEYAPKRLVAVLVSALFCGMPAGALLGGLISSIMLPRWGWQSVFYAGGILPFVLAFLLIVILPESVRYLEISGANPKRISRILARISPDLGNASFSRSPQQSKHRNAPVIRLFTEGRASATLLLWIPYFMNLLILYFVVSWLPALLRQGGMPVTAGIRAIILFSAGGIAGSAVEGFMINRWGAVTVMLVEFVCSAALIGSLAYSASFPLTMAITLVLGFTVQAAQGGLNVIGATTYPTSIRATGIGWALGVGRIGSIVGPVLVGVMLKLDWGPREIFQAGAIPALCAAAATLLSLWLRRNLPTEQQSPDIVEEPTLSH